MLIPILCAIVVVVGLITLISFNMVVREKESRGEESSAPDQAQPTDESEERVDVQQKEELIEDDTAEEAMADRDYRNALKRFQGIEESPEKQQDDGLKMSDNAYREALRAMKKKK